MSENKYELATSELLTGEIKKFLPIGERNGLIELLKGEEAEYIADLVLKMVARIRDMPVTYEQDDPNKDAIAYLHYFGGAANFWITEKDVDGGVQQAFGLANFFGGREGAELGYISIEEITACGLELDLYWEPKPLSQC